MESTSVSCPTTCATRRHFLGAALLDLSAALLLIILLPLFLVKETDSLDADANIAKNHATNATAGTPNATAATLPMGPRTASLQWIEISEAFK